MALSVELEVHETTFCKSVGWPGVGLCAFAIALAAGHVYLAAVYTYYFEDLGREMAWAFFFFAALFLLLVVYRLFSWNTVANKAMAMEKKAAKATGRPKTWYGRALLLKSHLDINGKWFLAKLYSSEVVQCFVQGYNLVTLYSCALSPGYVFGLCVFLTVDHAHRAHSLWQTLRRPATAASRDLRLFTDLVVDLVLMVLPLSVLYFGHNIPVTVWEMLAVIAWPTMSTIMKLDDLMEENVVRRSATQLVQKQRAASIRLSRRRSSLFRKTSVEEGLHHQDGAIGARAKRALTVFTATGGLFFLAMGVLAIGLPIECDALWHDSCTVKVPFCRMQLSCDCAVLHADRHNLTAVPGSLGAMKSLRSMTVTRGPLERLPPLRGFERMAFLNVSENRLTGVSSLPSSLQQLWVDMNRLQSLPELKEMAILYEIRASYNNISTFPSLGPRAWDVYLVNNSLEQIGDTNEVLYLEVGGNRIRRLADASKVRYLNAPNNRLATFPKWEALVHLDVRGNQLASLPDLAVEDVWVHGNPLCSNGWAPSKLLKEAFRKPGRGCTRQCSPTCLDIYVGDGVCNLECLSCGGEDECSWY